MDTDAIPFDHPVAVADELVAELSERLTAPQPGECLPCFTSRAVEDVGCDNTLRWAGVWREHCRPRATGLLGRLESRGGYCDCEVLCNVWVEDESLLTVDEETGERKWPMERPPCPGVGARSAESCVLWVPRRRGR